jgi:hypothetical protein
MQLFHQLAEGSRIFLHELLQLWSNQSSDLHRGLLGVMLLDVGSLRYIPLAVCSAPEISVSSQGGDRIS